MNTDVGNRLDSGFVLLSRGIFESDLWGMSDATLRIAIYLLLSANYADQKFAGKVVHRGECIRSLARIADDCCTSVKTVRGSIDRLVQCGFIQRGDKYGAHSGHIIKIVKYETYQSIANYSGIARSSELPPSLPPKGATSKEKKEEKEEKNIIPPTLEMVSEYCKHRGNTIDPQRFIDSYASKGWMIGKNKMKDWQAAIRTWEKNDKEKEAGNMPRDPYI